jgi:hypothetical protein
VCGWLVVLGGGFAKEWRKETPSIYVVALACVPIHDRAVFWRWFWRPIATPRSDQSALVFFSSLFVPTTSARREHVGTSRPSDKTQQHNPRQ